MQMKLRRALATILTAVAPAQERGLLVDPAGCDELAASEPAGGMAGFERACGMAGFEPACGMAG